MSSYSLTEFRNRKEEIRGLAGRADAAPGLFFYGFDRHRLVFVVAHRAAMPPSDRPVKRQQKWVATEVIEVERSPATLEALGVSAEVNKYERGVCGIAIGTGINELERRLGTPNEVTHPAAAGCVQHRYGSLHVGLCFGKVENISLVESAACP